MRSLERIAAVLVAPLLLSCGSSGDEDMLPLHLGSQVAVTPTPTTPTPPIAPAGKLDIGGDRAVAARVAAIERWLYRPRPTTPDAIEKLREMAYRLEMDLRHPKPTPAARRRVAHEVQVFGRHVARTLLVWTADHTLIEHRREWERLRDQLLFSADGFHHEPDPALDETQRQREPDFEIDYFDRVRFCEGELRWIEQLAHELAGLPEKERFRRFSDAVTRRLHTISSELHRPHPPMPRGTPGRIKSAWATTYTARGVIFGLLGMPWVEEFMKRAPKAAPRHVRHLERARESVEIFWDDGIAEQMP